MHFSGRIPVVKRHISVYGILQGCYLTVLFQVILQYINVDYFSTLKCLAVVLLPPDKFVDLPCFVTLCAKLKISIDM